MPTARPDRLTLRQVAAEVGVSAKTVSNAFTRPDQLSSATRKRVLAAAARLGYPGPNPLAAGLRCRCSPCTCCECATEAHR